jgi:hypothetical protein
VCVTTVLCHYSYTPVGSVKLYTVRDRLLGTVVSEELTAAVFSVTVCGKAVHLFPLAEYRVFLLSDYLSFVPSPGLWAVG